VYEQRPTVCRELTRGGPSCQAELTLKATSASNALRQLHSPA
jgi:hypothetical protein